VQRASVYVHFPWCLTKCPYCDFVSYATERPAVPHAAYADAVIAELHARAESFEKKEIASIFFGGGTPSLWEPAELGRVLAAIRDALACAPQVEVTVECNPTSLDRTRADALASVGVNRLSVGTQSLKQEQLSFLGRLHNPQGALDAVTDALASNIARVSTDLIFGLPEQSPDDARAQALALADLGLRHLSCYQLTIEPGTRFGELARRGRLPLADDGRVADAFLAIDEALAARGLVHYEISNYAAPGEEARHNLGYWRGEEYLGLGCGAYGFVRNELGGVRWRNEIDPARYLERAGCGSMSEEPLDAETLLRERIMLGLRLATGFDLEAAAADLGVVAWTDERSREADKMLKSQRLIREGAILRIPNKAWLFTDDTAARLF
jgi:oxygen-independent coproporphyrinogen-3 oxidase